jgi:hypothetical protein
MVTDPVLLVVLRWGVVDLENVDAGSSFIRQARASRPAPRMTTCGAGRARTASSIAIVRGTINSALARTAS